MPEKMSPIRVLIIGAGPSGMSVLKHLQDAKNSSRPEMEIICLEKQSTWGGLWNYDWRTGLDEHGEYVHASQYRYLWSNGPKEASLEFPDYTFEDHYGKSIPSFPPREVLFDYLQGRWKKYDLKKYIKFNRIVRYLKFVDNKFVVDHYNPVADSMTEGDTFDYVMNCTGHFSVPFVPTFEGIKDFKGRVLHAHDFKDAREFEGKHLLVVGSSYSAEDLSLQVIKYGAKKVTVSYRTAPMPFEFPEQITQRPLIKKINADGSSVTLIDDSTVEDIDVILMCTGYKHYYPYLPDSLRLTGPNVLYPENLYKGVVWMKSGGDKFFYVGAVDQYYTFTMFDTQAAYAVALITGASKLPSVEERQKDMAHWAERQAANKTEIDEIDFQADYVNELASLAGYKGNLDVRDLFKTWEGHKHDNLLTYRDQQFESKHTGKLSPAYKINWFKAFDDSLEGYVNNLG